MPVDGASVLRFLRKGSVPTKIGKQFELFKEIFCKYIELTSQLKLNPDNGDGNWWNISVPKRIDNAIGGFWKIFGNDNIERITCDHIDMLLKYLGIPLEVKYEIIITNEQAVEGMAKVLVRKGKNLNVSIPAGVKTGSEVRLENALKVTDGQPGDIVIKIKVK